MSLRVHYLGPFCAATGLASAAHDYLLALHRAGVELDIDPILPGTDIDQLPERYQELRPLVSVKPDNWATHYVVHTIPPYLGNFVTDEFAPPSDVPRIANTVWETWPLPKKFGEQIEAGYQKVIVPSEFNKAAFIAGGVSASKIAVVPHCYDPRWWLRPVLPRAPRLYTFYTIGVWAERKNILGLLKAYLCEFSSRDEVVLKVVSPDNPWEDVEALKYATLIPQHELPRVEFLGAIPNRLSEEEIWQLHATSDCYVSTTRGEGWGLGMFEASVMGNSVIAPRQGGQIDFLNHYPYTMYVETFMTPCVSPDAPVPGIINADQLWAEPDLAGVQTWMREAYTKRLRKDPSMATEVRRRFSYDAVGDMFKKVLEEALQ